MVDTSNEIDFDNHDQIRLLTNLRHDIKSLLIAHPKGIWFRMLPRVFYMHFNREIHLDLFAITNPYLFLDYISDLIQFDLPDNFQDDDFIIELNQNREKEKFFISLKANDLKLRRELLLKILEKAKLEKRGGLLREICIIDEQFEYLDNQEKTSVLSKKSTHEQVAHRFQKIRSMIDFYLRHLTEASEHISDIELVNLFENSEDFISDLTPLVQRLSLFENSIEHSNIVR